MSLKSVKNLETNIYELELEISAEAFSQAVNKAYLKEKGKISVPGFRKGKAPRAFIEKLYGEGVFYETALDSIYPEAVDDAIKESKLQVVASPFDAEVKNMSKEEGVLITFKVTTKPEVEIENYKGIEITKKSAVVTDEEIEAELQSYKEREAAYETVEGRAAQTGDMTVINFEGFVDGVAFEGGKGENYNLTLGSHSFIDTFEDQIVGHNAGDEFDVNVTFPEEYHAENLKGKPAVFKVKVNEIKEKIYPELDDEFAKDVSEFETFDEFKADLVKRLEEHKKQQVDSDVEEQIADKLADELKGEIPEVMYELKVDEFIRDLEMRLQGQGLNLELYMNYTGMDMDALRVTFKAQAERTVKVGLALEKIAELENITPSEEAVNNEYQKIVDTYKIELEAAKKAIDESIIIDDLKNRDALKFVKNNAKITEENN